MSLFPASSIPAGATGFDIDNSLVFTGVSQSNLYRTPSSTGNRKTWTWSGWVKRGNQNNYQVLFASKTNTASIFWTTANRIRVEQYNGAGGYNFRRDFEPVMRDSSAWYHIMFVFDTANGTESERIRMYLNGTQQDVNYTYDSMSQHFESEFNNTETHWLGRLGGWYFDGYLSEVHFVDGTALDPTSFGETGDYGEWKAKKVSGLTYGTNGFYLDFKAAGAGTSGCGKDTSGNSNNWSSEGLSAPDQKLDSPTNNFATLNPLQINSAITYSEGNLKAYRSAGDNAQSFGSIQVTSGKWYAEFYCASVTTLRCQVGVQINDKVAASNIALGQNGYSYRAYDGNKYINNTASSYGSTYTDGDIISVALDADNGDVTFYKNGTSQGEAFSGISADSFKIGTSGEDGWAIVANFGQDSSFAGNKTAQGNQDGGGIGDFYYTPPTGFLALCTKNLPDPTVIPSEHFNTVTYAGTGSSASIAGVGFQPDLVWIKRTNGVEDHRLTDVVRGVNLTLRSNTYNPEYTGNDVTAFNSDGFTNGGDSDDSGETYVAWNWKAGGTAVLNENGTIDSQVSANQDAGFSIVKYIGEATSSTIGHGLASKPEIVIIKNYEYDGSGWTTNVGNIPAFSASADMTAVTSANNYIIGYNVGGTYWLNTLPDNSVFTVSNPHAVNRLNYEHIAYCFHSVDGYSKIGSYTGNGSTDGTFVYTGFRPKYVMIKNATSVGHWQIHDTTRDTYNVMDNQLHINTNDADATSSAYYIDCLSNGFKLRMTHAGQNANGSKYLFYAIAEHPFKHTNAR